MSDEAELRLKTIVELAERDPPPDSAEGKLLDKLVDEQIKAEKRPTHGEDVLEIVRLRDLLEKAIHLVEGMRVFGNDNLQRLDVPPWLKAAREALEGSK